MINSCYVIAGAGLLVVGYLFQHNTISAPGLTIGWSIIFFFAFAGASAAYLTVSEIFPMETRAMAIAFFYAVATGIGGIIGPALYGHNIATGSRTTVYYGYILGAVLMILGGLTEVWLGVGAEQRQLEDIAEPLPAQDDPYGEHGAPPRCSTSRRVSGCARAAPGEQRSDAMTDA